MKISFILALILSMASFAMADCPVGDLNRDCKVDLYDFAVLAANWLEFEPNLPVGTVVFSEVLTHSHATDPDWLELQNTSGSPINIGGWYISDDVSPLTKYRIPDGTTIPAYGYIVFYEDLHFGVGVNGFGLSENGETLYLSLPRDGGYFVMDDRKFDAAETGVSFGLYATSIGDVEFPAMASNTPGQENSCPKVGPVVISEIMYDSFVDTDAEYIELHNVEDYPVTLQVYDPCIAGNVPWKFTEGPDFIFPLGATIPANGYLIVAKTNDPFEFRTWYPDTPAEINILGPFTGGTKLSNDGENVELAMPGDMDEMGVRAYIRIDDVKYSDGSQHEDFVGLDPWPTEPDTEGESLQRIDMYAYGNDVNNWQSGEATPGY